MEKHQTLSPDKLNPASGDKTELLPCPFCGAPAEKTWGSCGHNDQTQLIKCTKCPALMDLYMGDIVAAWNTRSRQS